MTLPQPPASQLPHHKLIAYQLALELVKPVARIRVADAQLWQQARKSAASAALNTAEGAARQTRADKARAYGIALAECCEACAAIQCGIFPARNPARAGCSASEWAPLHCGPTPIRECSQPGAAPYPAAERPRATARCDSRTIKPFSDCHPLQGCAGKWGVRQTLTNATRIDLGHGNFRFWAASAAEC